MASCASALGCHPLKVAVRLSAFSRVVDEADAAVATVPDHPRTSKHAYRQGREGMRSERHGSFHPPLAP